MTNEEMVQTIARLTREITSLRSTQNSFESSVRTEISALTEQIRVLELFVGKIRP